MQTKISVIVAVYNAEAYLHRCVDSLLAQTFRDFEILLINDGSLDKSGEICDAYALKDSRVHVFHKENEGVSAARQLGIEQACGIYSIHADSDDWVEPLMLEGLYNKAIKEDADLVICDYLVETARGTKYKKCEPTSFDHKQVLKELFQQLHGSCCNKLIKLACYKKYNVSFPKNLNHGEDAITWILLLQHPLKITYLAQAYYHYDQSNLGSLTSIYSLKVYQERKKYVCMLHKLLDYEIFERVIVHRQIALAYYAIRACIFDKYKFKQEFDYLSPILEKNNSSVKIPVWLSLNGFYYSVVCYYKLKQKMFHISYCILRCKKRMFKRKKGK